MMWDIGANVGEVSLHFSRICDKVIAFECNPNLVSKLHRQFDGTNVVVDKRGLADTCGIKHFKICDASTLSTFSEEWTTDCRFSKEHYWDIEIPVDVITLDAAIEEYGKPDYVKIDVEGYEYNVIKGLTKCLEHTIFSFEWVEEQTEDIKKIIEYVRSIGYTKFYYTDRDGVLVNENITWYDWDELDFFEDITPERAERWGMIYFKKDATRLDKKPFSWKRDINFSFLNLPSRTDRYNHMIAELARVGLDAKRTVAKTPDEVPDITDSKYAVMYKRTKGAIPCYLGQMDIIRKSHERGKSAGVFEDDLIFCDDFSKRMDVIQKFCRNNPWDIIFLGGTYHKEPTWHKLDATGKHSHPDLTMCGCSNNCDWERTSNPRIVRTYGAFSTHAYIVNHNSANKILDLLDQNMYRSMGIDWTFILLQPQLHAYAFVPGMVKQLDNRSNIGDGITYFSNFASLGQHWFSEKM